MSFLTTAKKGLVRACFLAFLTALPFAVGASDHAARKAQFENRLASVKALSSAVARDAGADRAEVKATISKVAARQKEAEELAAVGEFDAARMILDEGYALLSRTLVTLKAGTGYTGPSGSASAEGAGTASRQQASYERSMASARALLDAARRASAEAGGTRAPDLPRIEATLVAAEQAGKAGDYVRGDGLANDALKDLRPLLVSLKGGASGGAVTAAAAASGEQDTVRRLAAFDNRMMSAKAMAGALKRQNQEKSAGKDAAIDDIESRLRQAEALRGGNITAAQGLLDQAYEATKLALQSMQTPTQMSSSGPVEAGGVAGGAAAERAEVDRILKSSSLLRDAVVRISKEKNADSSVAVARIDTLAAEARNRQASDTSRALQAANEANQTAKDALAKLR